MMGIGTGFLVGIYTPDSYRLEWIALFCGGLVFSGDKYVSALLIRTTPSTPASRALGLIYGNPHKLILFQADKYLGPLIISRISICLGYGRYI